MRTGAIPAHPSKAKLARGVHQSGPGTFRKLSRAGFAMAITLSWILTASATAETRPHYGGTLRVMLQSAPDTLDIPTNPAATGYWDEARTLSLIGDTLVKLDVQDRPQPALAVAWQCDLSGRFCQFTLRRGVKFHDGSVASPSAIAQIVGALHPNWTVRATTDTLSIESDMTEASLLAELALPRNLLLKRNASHVPIGTGAFIVAQWQPGVRLTLAANEENWAGRPFVDQIQLEFGKSLRDQAIALELDKVDITESAPQSSTGTQRHGASSSSSLPVELLALVFSPNSKAQDPHLREALALAIDRKPIQSVLLKGAGEPTASILPNWMTGYGAVFFGPSDPQRARSLLAGTRQPAFNLSYDPRDPQAQLIAERIALNAREAGITVQVSLSGAEDIRLMRAVLPSPDPVTSLGEAARQLGLPRPASLTTIRGGSPDDLYPAERTLLDGYAVIPLFHLPVASMTSPRVRDWEPDRMGRWDGSGSSLADLWLADRQREVSRENPGSDSLPRTASR